MTPSEKLYLTLVISTFVLFGVHMARMMWEQRPGARITKRAEAPTGALQA